WPDGPEACERSRARARLDFGPAREEAPPTSDAFLALAVTCDDYLVAAYANGAERGFLSFDLVAGGPPLRTAWPRAGFAPVDLAARACGGVWVLDRADDAAA